MRTARYAVRHLITTGFVDMTFGWLAFRLGIREDHFVAQLLMTIVDKIDKKAKETALASVKFAEESPEPPLEKLYDYTYAP